MDPLAQAVLTLASGAVGAGLGAAVALQRFKRERAFSHRISWYEEMVRALNGFGTTLQAIIHATAREDDEKVEELKQLASAQEEALLPILSDRELYAKQSGYSALQRFIIEANKLSELQLTVLRVQAEMGGEPGAAVENFAPALLRVTNEAAEALATEFRQELFGRFGGRVKRTMP